MSRTRPCRRGRGCAPSRRGPPGHAPCQPPTRTGDGRWLPAPARSGDRRRDARGRTRRGLSAGSGWAPATGRAARRGRGPGPIGPAAPWRDRRWSRRNRWSAG
ncbi:hypothetical protein EII35_13360 [Arachnia propionica]|uniref:Uncharacterized protein n=1 Tax=Arachnia propionica TaxID=1750 RepID=A0A3P1WRE4_9ACTN|nr:hypothetical protein EII35_13360 [Arachnia propionica]